jgi:phosphoglycerate dehydrogenase-like enzyme
LAARVAILDDYQRVAARLVGDLGPGVELEAFADHVAEEDELVARLEPFEVVVAMRERTPFPARVLERLPGLRLLVTTGMGNASIDLAAAARRGILVSGTRILVHPTAELALGLILALARRIPAEDAALRAGRWQVGVGVSLHGRRLGLIGLGKLGKQMARLGEALGMEVVAWSASLTPETAAEAGAAYLPLAELLATADVVSVHTRLSERTRGLLGRDQLALMKPTALLVNTSRGPIVDEAALVEALEACAIAGAALDVFDEEPLPPEHPLRAAPNTVLTPHIGYVADDNYRVFFDEIAEDIRAFLAGSPVRALNEPS